MVTTMKINGCTVPVGKCAKCGRVENYNLLDTPLDEDGNPLPEYDLLCIRCYGKNWSPARMSDLDYSVQQDFTLDYEHYRNACQEG